MNVGELKKLLADLPDDMPAMATRYDDDGVLDHAEPVYPEVSTLTGVSLGAPFSLQAWEWFESEAEAGVHAEELGKKLSDGQRAAGYHISMVTIETLVM